MLHLISTINDLHKDFGIMPSRVSLVTIPQYTVNKNHSREWNKLILRGNEGEAKELVRSWVDGFTKVCYSHNERMQKAILKSYASLRTYDKVLQVDSKVLADVLVVFR